VKADCPVCVYAPNGPSPPSLGSTRLIFTHHDTNTHAHVIHETPAITGHIDHVDMDEGARLYLPVR